METIIMNRLKGMACAFIAISSLSFSAFASEGKVLIFQPQGEAFEQVSQAVKDDMSEEVDIVIEELNSDLSPVLLLSTIKQQQPDALVMLGNAASNALVKLKRNKFDLPPAIVTAALFVDQSLQGIDGVSSIRYEVPLVTSLVNVRNAVTQPIQKVGVLYRQQLQAQLAEQAKYCEAEGIQLVTEPLPDSSPKMYNHIDTALQHLKNKGVDAFVMLNDNVLINEKTVKKAWMPQLRRTELPVIVGVDALLNSGLGIGSFSMVPDHYGLGMQTASLLWDLLDNDWELESSEFYQPLSIKKKINVTVLNHKHIVVNDSALNSFDEVISH